MLKRVGRAAGGTVAGAALWLALVGCTAGNGEITPSPQTAPTQTANVNYFQTQRAAILATLTAPAPRPSQTPAASSTKAGQ